MLEQLKELVARTKDAAAAVRALKAVPASKKTLVEFKVCARACVRMCYVTQWYVNL